MTYSGKAIIYIFVKSLNIVSVGSRLALLVCASIALTSCEWVCLKNGEIPEAHIPWADEIQQTVALAPKSFEARPDLRGKEATLSLKLEGRKIVLKPSFDFWGPGCGSKIGDAEILKIESGRLREITFDTDPGRCDPALIKSHRDLHLIFAQDSKGRYVVYSTEILVDKRQRIRYFWE